MLEIYFFVHLLFAGIRARSLFFFLRTNRWEEEDERAAESKGRLQSLIPKEYDPCTRFFKAGTQRPEVLDYIKKHTQFPVVIKPNLGAQAYHVKIVTVPEQLSEVLKIFAKEDFLLQKFVDLPREGSIFYYRMPREDHGQLISVVRKVYPCVRGDGVSTLGELLQKDASKRHLEKVCARMIPTRLKEVPKKNEEYAIHPIGTYFLGAQIVDESQHITPALTQFIDKIMRQVKGFHYGRIDVKYRSYEDFLGGGPFQIVECNGVFSTPLPIFSGAISQARSYREIGKYVRIMRRIARANDKIYGKKNAWRLVRKSLPPALRFLARKHLGGSK